MAKERLLTCIVCPRGCQMKVTLSDDGKPTAVEGNFCKRGATYANDECTNPKRTVTSTVRCKSGDVVSVKTDRTVPKGKMFEIMDMIRAAAVEAPVKIGDVILRDVYGTQIVATKEIV